MYQVVVNQINYIKKPVLRYCRFTSKLIIIINIILDHVQCINYKNVRVQRSDVKWYHTLAISNDYNPDVVEKGDRILGVVIFIFNLRFQNINYVFVKTVQLGDTRWKNRAYRNPWLLHFGLIIESRGAGVSMF